MSIKRSREYLAEFWPSTAQLKEQYAVARKSLKDTGSNITSRTKNDAQFDELILLFHGQLLEFFKTVCFKYLE